MTTVTTHTGKYVATRVQNDKRHYLGIDACGYFQPYDLRYALIGDEDAMKAVIKKYIGESLAPNPWILQEILLEEIVPPPMRRG